MITSSLGLGGDGNGELGVDERLAVGDDDADIGHQRSVAGLFLEINTLIICISFAYQLLHPNCIAFAFHGSCTKLA